MLQRIKENCDIFPQKNNLIFSETMKIVVPFHRCLFHTIDIHDPGFDFALKIKTGQELGASRSVFLLGKLGECTYLFRKKRHVRSTCNITIFKEVFVAFCPAPSELIFLQTLKSTKTITLNQNSRMKPLNIKYHPYH